ncbi:MAG TPA: hypothetical protein VNK95_13700 [Caldilineaceae bacterium]|nr:hypothetical protein [Caldilineaceae bacterium]
MRAGIAAHPKAAALLGFLLMLPFVALNAIVGNRIEPFFSFIRPAGHTSPLELVLLFAVILLIPVGALIAGLPMLQRGADGRRPFYLVNGILAALLVAVFVLLALTLGEEIYRCDILQIPNCD